MKKIFIGVFGVLLFVPAWTPPASAASTEGALIKLSCPADAGVNHPCKAVYYHGHDGKRHAFPNAKVYSTWYPDFSGVTTISGDAMAAIPLGRNVTYRPGARMVKFITDPKVYAVALGGELRWIASESLAVSLFGPDWNQRIDDIPDAFFSDYRFGEDISEVTDYTAAEELSFAPDIDADLPSTRRGATVSATTGEFDIELVTLQRGRHAMRTSVAEDSDCEDACAAFSLKDHAARYGAAIGIHGSYFCPPDYSDCEGKTNSFLSPFYDPATDFMANEKSLEVHKGPVMASSSDGWHFYRSAKDFGSNVDEFEAREGAVLEAAASNYPALMENGNVIVLDEPRYEDGMETKAVRGGMGWNERFVFLVVARRATVEDLAHIMNALGAADAMNLDGGGSAALLYDGTYRFGPGRLLPNAVLFTPR